MKTLRSNSLTRLARNLQNTLLDSYYWRLSHDEFIERLRDVRGIEDVIDIAWQYKGYGFYRILKPNQDRWELTTLVSRVQALRPKVIVEIGTRYGGTLLPWSQCSDELRLLVSIDLPGGIHGGGYTAQRTKLLQLFTSNQPQCKLELLRMDSQQEATRSKLVKLLNGQPIDFLFIDGDHRYAGVKKDYDLYAELVRSGGLIAFHDIRPNTVDASIEVYRLWNEIVAAGKQVEEIIHEPYCGQFGIGVLTKA